MKRVFYMDRYELLELHFRKDRHIDFLHNTIKNMYKHKIQMLKYNSQLCEEIQYLHGFIDMLKIRLFKLSGTLISHYDPDGADGKEFR